MRVQLCVCVYMHVVRGQKISSNAVPQAASLLKFSLDKFSHWTDHPRQAGLAGQCTPGMGSPPLSQKECPATPVTFPAVV